MADMMKRKQKAIESDVMQRRELVQSYWLRGLKPWRIAETLKVSPKTIYRDLEAIQTQLAKAVEGRRIYNVQRCFAELDEEWREAWILYHRPPRKDMGRRGEVVTLDDRPIKTLLLGSSSRCHCGTGQTQRLLLTQGLGPDNSGTDPCRATNHN